MSLNCFDKAPQFIDCAPTVEGHQAVCACDWASKIGPQSEVMHAWVEHTQTPHRTRIAPASEGPFSTTTWSGVDNQVGRDGQRPTLYWQDQHDLAVELWHATVDSGWDFETASAAVAAAVSGLPVLITWATPFHDKVEVNSGHAIIDGITYAGRSTRLRLRYSGFSHYVAASSVRYIRQVGVTNRIIADGEMIAP